MRAKPSNSERHCAGRIIGLSIAFAAFSIVAGCAESAPAAAAGPGLRSTEVHAFLTTIPNHSAPPSPTPAGMVWIAGGEFSMGMEDPRETPDGGHDPMADTRPIHRVYIDGFWMDTTEVTNEQFARFVKATGYITVAERKPRAEDFPGAPPENLVAGSVVFAPPDHPVQLNDHYQWWSYVPGANWRHPLGPQSDLKGKEKYPAVQIAYEDAAAYAKWAGQRLPTEAEFEFAARGGLTGKRFAWGDDFHPGGKAMANTHQGHFPDADRASDGYAGIAPVAHFPANGYGLYDIAGNAWEWTSDWYRSDYYQQLAAAGGVVRNPQGPDSPYDPAEPTEKKRVQRGGSFLCTDQYCSRYLVGSRGKGEVTSGSNHLGFRLVMSRPAKAADKAVKVSAVKAEASESQSCRINRKQMLLASAKQSKSVWSLGEKK